MRLVVTFHYCAQALRREILDLLDIVCVGLGRTPYLVALIPVIPTLNTFAGASTGAKVFASRRYRYA